MTKIEEGLFHELVEAVNYHLELRLEHNQITPISEGLYTVLKDNGWLDFKGIFYGDNR